jgi:hypothetical protein
MLAERRRHPFIRYRAAAGILALAACLALIIWLRQPPGPLPQYALYAAGDEQKLGRSVATAVKLVEDSVLSLTLRPWEAVHGEVATRAFLYRDGRLRPWNVQLQALNSGTFQVQAPAQELGLTTGRWEIIVVVGRGKDAPASEQLQRALAASAPASIDGWQVLRLPIEILKNPLTER